MIERIRNWRQQKTTKINSIERYGKRHERCVLLYLFVLLLLILPFSCGFFPPPISLPCQHIRSLWKVPNMGYDKILNINNLYEYHFIFRCVVIYYRLESALVTDRQIDSVVYFFHDTNANNYGNIWINTRTIVSLFCFFLDFSCALDPNSPRKWIDAILFFPL